MTPDPHPTKAERADELEAAAHKAFGLQDFVFAKQLADHADRLRMEVFMEIKNGLRHRVQPFDGS